MKRERSSVSSTRFTRCSSVPDIVLISQLTFVQNLGKAEGSVSGSEIIKPALARGLQLVGATTPDEYRKTIEKDAALQRRFQPIMVEEPSVESTISILRGLKGRLEAHHGIAIGDSGEIHTVYDENPAERQQHW